MTLYINTTEAGIIKLALKRGREVIAEKKVKSVRREAEKLLPAIETMLKAKKVKLSQIKKIEVANRGGSFTSLRIGVVTANALAYALGAKPFKAVEPLYDREPEITKKKSRSS